MITIEHSLKLRIFIPLLTKIESLETFESSLGIIKKSNERFSRSYKEGSSIYQKNIVIFGAKVNH